jgi:hypothetical protein
MPTRFNLDLGRGGFNNGPDLSFQQRPVMSIDCAPAMIVWLACDRRQQANDQVGTGRNGERAPRDQIAHSVTM